MSEPLSPRTARLLYRLMVGLAAAAGMLFILAFLAGLAREGAERWALLALGLVFLAAPLVLRRAIPPP